VPRPQGGGGGEGIKGNPDANNNERGRPTAAAQADVDFGPYMADLQRRIKRAWFPPKGNESKRVVVVFKIHKDGTMSNLRLDHSSGLAIADQAALKAVENAAPFRPLPAGAQDDVDIQFTFDYNVFGGGGRGVMRSF
jgi:TonB family protein